MVGQTLHGGGLQARQCLKVEGRGLCGLQDRDTTAWPWAVTCPVCKRMPEYQAAVAEVAECAVHKVPISPWAPCPACASPPS